ncbi:MAG: DUF3098 domain-containing protein [Bacteroidales bacterium]|nr:DUF3098 domain-containing protein [Bacteroidales bacterium]
MSTQNFSKLPNNKTSDSLNSNLDENNSKGFALEKINYILIAISFALIILGFALMGGESSTPDNYNADIFSWRRIVLGPTISFIGFVAIIFGIMYKKKGDK